MKQQKNIGRGIHTRAHTRTFKEKGITLIALVVTIVILIILASISISVVFNENGIIKEAQKSKEISANSTDKEQEDLQKIMKEYNDIMAKASGWDLNKVLAVTSEDNIIVPVPKGYTPSTVAGEKRVDEGFVIKEGNNGEITTGINEFVWVPVKDISDICDAKNKSGQLWDFGTSSAPNNPAIKRAYPAIQNSGYREPDVVTQASEGSDSTSGKVYDAVSKNLQEAGLSSTATASDFKKQLQSEFNNMIESIKIYGGFYIGRYETGNISQSKAVVQKNNLDITSQTWYTHYKISKTLKANDNVTSSMIWGCQWDAVMRWMQSSDNEEVVKYVTDSTGKGNYSGVNENQIIPTGSNKNYEVNNIFDMAGNVMDRTIESDNINIRVGRGGYYGNNGANITASSRFYSSPTSIDSSYGSRATLYISCP